MDVAFPPPISRVGVSSAPAATPDPSTARFDDALGAQITAPRSVADEVEGLVGQRIKAPPGGCGCDALVSNVDAAVPKAATGRSESVLDMVRPGEIQRGDVLVLRSSDGLPGARLHQAVARGLSEMIAVNSMGVVEVTDIPWSLVEGRHSSSAR